MPVPDKALVQEILAKHDRDIICRRAVEDGWRQVKEKHPDLTWWRRKATRAGVMWENTVQNAISMLVGVPGAKHVPHFDTASFIFDDTILVRFKVANIGLLTSNYPTLLALQYDRHERDLFGFRGHQRVEVVHVLNRFGTALEWIGVVARERRKVIWDFELRSGAAAGATIETLTLKPRTDTAADRVLRPAKPGRKDEKKNDEDKGE